MHTGGRKRIHVHIIMHHVENYGPKAIQLNVIN